MNNSYLVQQCDEGCVKWTIQVAERSVPTCTMGFAD